MGSKRLGLARTQALLENLNREIEGGSLTFKSLKVQQAKSGSAGFTDSRDSPQQMTISFLYDSGSRNGDIVGEMLLSGADGKSHAGLPVGFCATSGWLEVVTAPTSTGSATIAIGTQGTSNDPDGFFSASVLGELAVNTARGFNGALVSNGTGPHEAGGFDPRGYRVVTAADPVTITVGVAPLATGKFWVHINGYMHKYNA
tara:strand:+ start:4868 stop:5470 length:603 start_codon:yes stop_codon:yes gene_type:complete